MAGSACCWQRSSPGDHRGGIKAHATPRREPDALLVSHPRQMSELQASSTAAQRAIREYHRTVKQDILRSVQLAKGMREAYPCLLNTLAICAVLGARLLMRRARRARRFTALQRRHCGVTVKREIIPTSRALLRSVMRRRTARCRDIGRTTDSETG